MAQMDNRTRAALVKLIDSQDTCTLMTVDENGVPLARPMANSNTGKSVDLWFATSAASNKVRHVNANGMVGIYVYNPETWQYASIMCEAEVVTCEETRAEFWEDEFTNWWSGPDDPDYVLLKCTAKSVVFCCEELESGAKQYEIEAEG